MRKATVLAKWKMSCKNRQITNNNNDGKKANKHLTKVTKQYLTTTLSNL